MKHYVLPFELDHNIGMFNSESQNKNNKKNEKKNQNKPKQKKYVQKVYIEFVKQNTSWELGHSLERCLDVPLNSAGGKN